MSDIQTIQETAPTDNGRVIPIAASLGADAHKFCLYHYGRTRDLAAKHGADYEVLHEQSKFINSILPELELLIAQGKEVDISTNEALKQKLLEAGELGAIILMDDKSTKDNPIIKTKLTLADLQANYKNLERLRDDWTKDCQLLFNKMQEHQKYCEQWLTMASNIAKEEKNAKSGHISGIRGG